MRRVSPAQIGLGCALALMAAAMTIPAVLDWNVHVNHFPPLHADWSPRVGPGTLPAVLIGLLATRFAASTATQSRWGRLLGWAFMASLAWMLALALVDGSAGIGDVLEHRYEYLSTARRYDDFAALLPGWVERITYAAYPNNWPVHVAGHPPGATLFFWVLVQLGLGSGLAAGLVVIVIAASTPVAVLTLMRRLGAEQAARDAAPFLVFGPVAIWSAVSGDAVFAACAAWGLCALGHAATARTRRSRVGTSVLAGILLGWLVMMSYGLPLFGIVALAVLWLAAREGGSWWPLPIAAASALAVVLSFAGFGFDYLDALSALHTRYWEGIASRRPPTYWMWGNLAAFAFAAGPFAFAGASTALGRLRVWRSRPETPVPAVLSISAVAMVLAADLSQMSRAEVERIWVPFVPWLMVGCALLSARWRTVALFGQIMFALVVQHLLFTGW